MSARKAKGRGGWRPGAGAKPIPAHKRRSEQIAVRLTKRELRELEKAAGDEPVSAFVRKLILRELERRRHPPKEYR